MKPTTETKQQQLEQLDSLQLTSRATSRQKEHSTNTNKGTGNSIIETLAVNEPNMSHKAAIELIIEKIKAFRPGLMESVAAVGHRVVHGGTELSDATVVNDDVLKAIQNVSHLAPL